MSLHRCACVCPAHTRACFVLCLRQALPDGVTLQAMRADPRQTTQDAAPLRHAECFALALSGVSCRAGFLLNCLRFKSLYRDKVGDLDPSPRDSRGRRTPP